MNADLSVCCCIVILFCGHQLLNIISLLTVTHLKWAGPMFPFKSEPHWKSISLCFNVSPLCGIFHTCRSHLWSSGSHVGSNASSTGSHSGSGNLHWEPSGPAIWDSACPYMLVCFPVSVWDERLCGGEMFSASISVGTQRNTWPWLTQTSTYSLSHTQFRSRVYYWVCVNVLLRGVIFSK